VLTDLQPEHKPWVKKEPYDFLARLHQKSTDVGNFWQRQLHLINLSAFASNKFNAVENHLQFPWQRQQTCGRCGLTLNRPLSMKLSTCGENDSRLPWRPKENTEHLLWLAVAYFVQMHCFKQYLNVSVIFVNSVLRMTHDRQHTRADSNIMSAGSLLYTCYVQLQYYVSN